MIKSTCYFIIAFSFISVLLLGCSANKNLQTFMNPIFNERLDAYSRVLNGADIRLTPTGMYEAEPRGINDYGSCQLIDQTKTRILMKCINKDAVVSRYYSMTDVEKAKKTGSDKYKKCTVFGKPDLESKKVLMDCIEDVTSYELFISSGPLFDYEKSPCAITSLFSESPLPIDATKKQATGYATYTIDGDSCHLFDTE